MKTKIYLLLLSLIFVFGTSFSQNEKNVSPVDTPFFNYAYWNGLADKEHLTDPVRTEFIHGHKKLLYDKHFHKHDSTELVWVKQESPSGSSFKKYGSNTVNAGPCTNIDFETGTFAGWTRWTGDNPLKAGSIGCCPNPNGDQTIMSGGVDPFGGFPVVYPGGGNFSLRLGSTAIGGIADRVEQTFFVTPANANFTYRYAVVLNDPVTGHTIAQKPKFVSEIIDSLQRPIACTTYSVISGGNIPGFVTSSLTANGDAVVSKAWTDVAVDLSPNIGQNVTIRFTVMDCGPTGHFAYAYLDGLCTNFATSVADTTCPNVPISICAPAGFSTTTWNGPGITNDPNQCIVITTPGVYTCITLLVPGCPGPTFTHTLSTLAKPAVSFTPSTSGPCATQYSFAQTMSISANSIVSHIWDFGDGTTSTALNPVHNYAAAGNYPVKLKATSSRGCMDSVINFINIFPVPNLVYSPPSNCINTVVQFTNSSTIGVGSITGYTWNLGNGNPASNLVNPTETYGTNGTYTITLTGISNQGCVSSLTQTLGIFPPPIISFTANALCDINGTAFSPSTSAAIVSGSLTTYNWDFGDGSTSGQANPVHTYTAPNTYVVLFTAISNHNCSASTSQTLIVSPTPTIAFTTTSVNACTPNFTFTNNSAISAGPITYTWSLGGTNTTNATSFTHTFPSIGDYTVMLIGTSNMNCADTAIQYISVYPYPIINFSVPASCENAIFTVSTTAVSGSVTSYLWDFGDPVSGAANSSTLQNPTHYFSTTNVYTLNLDIISNLNCPSNYTTLVTVYPNPVATFSYSTLNNCSFPYLFANNSTVSNIGGSTLSGYRWDFGPAGTSTLASPGTANFPAHGSYSVSLIAITNHNCSDTMTSNILVHPLPSVDFTANATCANKSLTITPTSSISPVPLATSSVTSYIFNYGDGFFTNSVTPAAHNYSASGTYTLTYSGTSNMGCSSSVTKTVAIYSVPALNFTTTNICLGLPTQFTSTSSIPSGTIFALSWDFGDATPPGANANTTHTYATSGLFNVKFFAITDKECSDTIIKPVVVHPLPVVSYTAANGCLNTPTFLDGTATITTGFVNSYSWDYGDGGFSTQQQPTHTFTTYATYTPSLTATSNMGCIGTATNNVTIHPLPNIAFSPPGACVNTAIQFTNTSNIPLGTISNYVWDFNDGTPTVSVIQPLHTFTLPATYVVTVTASSDQNCIGSAVKSLSIFPYPSVSITPINSSCVNDLVSLYPNVSISGNNNPISGYTLSFGDGSPAVVTTTPLPFTLSHLYTAYDTYTVSLSAISNGCRTNTTTTVKVYPKPFTNFVASNFCRNDITQFVNTSSIAATYTIQEHNWDFGDGAVPQSTFQNTSHIFSAPGTFSVKLTELTYPEAGLTCSTSIIKTITINPVPIPSFNSNSVCAGAPTSFINNTPPTSPTQTVTGWSWYFQNNGVLNSSLQSPSFIYSASGTYTALLTALNNFGCTGSVLNEVNVWANPTVTFTANNNCLKAATPFTEGSTIANTPVNSISTWDWKFGDGGVINNTQNPTYTYLNFGTFQPTLTVTSNKGCITSLAKSVTIHPLPTIVFTPPGACVNTAVQFANASSIPLGSIVSHTWEFGDNTANATVTHPVHTYALPATYVVTLTGTSDQGCVKTAIGNIVISPYPHIQITTLGSKCVNETFTVSPVVSITGVNNVISGYTVSFGDGSPAVITATPLQYTVGHVYTANTANNTYTINLSAISNGCRADTSAIINVYPNPFTNFASSKYCQNDPTNFVNTSTISPSGTISAYLWDFDDGAASTSTLVSPTYSFSLPGVKNVSLTALTYPEPSLTCSVMTVKTITINPVPILSAFSTNTVCMGNPTQFTNHTSTTGVIGWSWVTNGVQFSISNNPSYTYPASGKFLASLVALNSFSCRDTITDSVAVYANPTASFVTNNDCFGKQSVFSNQSLKGDGSLTTYTWNTNGNPGFSFDQNGLFSYPAPGTYTVELIQGSSLGCIGKFTNAVTVHPLPNVNFTISDACQNAPTVFTNLSSINNGSISSFQWIFNDPASGTNSLSTLTNPTHLFPQAGSYATTLEAVSDKNCRSLPKVINAIVHGAPFANFTNTTICAGNSLPFVNLSTSSDGTIRTSEWDFNGDNIVDQNTLTPSYTYSLHGNYLASLVVTTQFGCWDSIVKPIYANPKPAATISSNNRAGCPPMVVNFSLSATSGSFSTTWDFGDGSPVSTLPNTSHPFETGHYDITLTLMSTAGCETKFVHPGYVNVYPIPVAGFNVEPEEVDEDEPIITVSNEASSDASSIKYFINDGSSFGSPNFTHSIKNLKQTKPMVVQIVRNPQGCADTLFKVLEIKPAYVVYFPDVFTPNGDGINDDFRPKGVGIIKFNMNIYDRWGHQVFQTNDMTETWDGISKNGQEPVKQDVYTWRAQVTDIFNKNHFLVGRVTVIR